MILRERVWRGRRIDENAPRKAGCWRNDGLLHGRRLRDCHRARCRCGRRRGAAKVLYRRIRLDCPVPRLRGQPVRHELNDVGRLAFHTGACSENLDIWGIKPLYIKVMSGTAASVKHMDHLRAEYGPGWLNEYIIREMPV